ncbi:hypothetical protein DMA15_29960 [Streptomyces sp. WAC 01529]|nr:hypothetical protein DMA15_29960 [Streptomyces sp. WAC 01529]
MNPGTLFALGQILQALQNRQVFRLHTPVLRHPVRTPPSHDPTLARSASTRRANREFVCFDLLEHAGNSLLSRPGRERLDTLRSLFASEMLGSPWALVASTTDRAVAQEWMDPAWGRVGVEGVVLRSGSRPYRPGARELIKVRAYESAEAIFPVKSMCSVW